MWVFNSVEDALKAWKFNTIEEAVEYWNKEAERAFKKTSKSGVLCECYCYRREDDIRAKSPLKRCTLLIPKGIYNDYLKWTSERYKDPDYKFPYVAVMSPGVIRVRFYGGRDDYTLRQNLCENSFRVDGLLKRYLGKKIRLGKNILVDKPDRE